MTTSRWRSAYGYGCAALALVLAACGSGGSSGSNSVGTNNGGGGTIAGLQANNHGQQDVTGKMEATLQETSFYFQPSVLKGSPGQAVTLHISNVGSIEHNFTLAAQHINSDVDPHGSVVVHVTFPASGILSFWCAYHKSDGMAGGLLTSGSVSGSGGSSSSGSSPSSSSGGGGYGGYGGG